MENVYKKLGKHNVNVLLKEVREGNIPKPIIKIIASKMSGRVQGKFVENEQMNAENLMIVLLQCWFKDVLFRPNVDGYTELIKILNDDIVHLSYVAHMMTNNILAQNRVQQISSSETNEEERLKSTDNHSAYDIEPGCDIKSSYYEKPPSCKQTITNWFSRHQRDVRIAAIFSMIGAVIGIGIGVGIGIGRGPDIWSLILDEKVYSDFKQNCSDQLQNATASAEHVEQIYEIVQNSTAKKTMSGICEDNLDILIEYVNSFSLRNKNNQTSPYTRSLRVKDGRFEELYNCQVPQRSIPDLPAQLDDISGIYTDQLGLLVCGGRDKGEQPRTDHPRVCYTHKLGSDGWKECCKLNTNRIGSYIKMNDNKIIILGGHSSDPMHDCYQSQEVLDLDNLPYGWREEACEGFCFTGQIVEVPCI